MADARPHRKPRPDSDRAPEPVAEIGELARIKATGEPPEGVAAKEILEAARPETRHQDED